MRVDPNAAIDAANARIAALEVAVATQAKIIEGLEAKVVRLSAQPSKRR